ncbi:His Kinase A (phospho-acceptor) domain-containing protein [Marinospirillum celere]|uniref:histidine kinase n=1 Tax=Marinospirillum celere TaxID=1122252 RepID=A0A1I1FMF2_9GAMM|nr:HAMP domain-containing sensor histidine kinase [Marinospirillum celere]SFC00607.1 His Kinase A (phospho-acceptor) domain-containing protein [Marinospirillum celere]
MSQLLKQPLPLRVWLETERDQLNQRVADAQQKGQELAVRLEITSSDRSKPAGPHDLLKHFIAAEIRMRQLLLSHPAPLMITDDEGRMLLTNVAAKKLLAAMGYNFNKTQPVYPLLEEAFPDFKPDQEVYLQVDEDYSPTGEVVLLAKETSIKWQETPARILLFHDISVESQARHKLENAISSLEEINRMKSEFMSMATHEFRTPLASIYSSLQLMDQYCQKLAQETESKWLDKLLRHVKRSEEAIQHLDGLVQEMLVLEKSQAGRTRFDPYPVSVGKLVEEVVDSLTPLAEKLELPISYSCQLEDPSKTYPVDAQLIQHILTNLLSNALKFSTPGQEISIQVKEVDTWLCLQIEDQGRGIPAEDLDSLGEPFFRAGNVDNVQGTGLGLSIVKRFVDLHQGRLEITSQLGQGSCFRVWLPINLQSKENEI